MVVTLAFEWRDAEALQPREVARDGNVSAHLSQEESDALGSQARTGQDDVSLSLASRVPDNRRATGRDLRDDLLDTGSPRQVARPRESAGDGCERRTRRLGMPTHQLAHKVRLEIHPSTRCRRRQRRLGESCRYQSHRETVPRHLGDGEAYALKRDGALCYQIVQKAGGWSHPEASTDTVVVHSQHLAHRIDVPLDEVPVERVSEVER